MTDEDDNVTQNDIQVSPYSDRFLNFIPFIVKWEGVYAKGHDGDNNFLICENDPDDPGGLTYCGIDKASHPNFDFKNPSYEQALNVYWSEWQKEKCEDKILGLGEVYFNACVNCGQGRADRFLAASKNSDEFLDNQEQFYKNLAIHNPRMTKFLKGWLNRTTDLRKFIAALK